MRAKREAHGMRHSLIRWATGLALLGSPAGAAPAPGAAGAEEPESPRALARGVNDGASDRSGSADRRPSDTPRAATDGEPGSEGETAPSPGLTITLRAGSAGETAQTRRWVQVGGPPAASAIEQPFIYTFSPKEPGRYRFAFVAGAEGATPRPEHVTIELRAGAAEGRPPAELPATSAFETETDPLAARAASAIRRVEEGPALAPRLAEALEQVVERISLYHSYADVHREIALRLETILPVDPNRRAAWASEVFEPLSAELIARLRAEGFDLASAEGRRRRLRDSARDALAERFQAIAQGFRHVAARVGSDGPAPVARGDQVVQ